MAGNDPNRARVIWVKLRLKQTFPDTFNEALNPVPMPPLPYYQSVLGAAGLHGRQHHGAAAVGIRRRA